MSDRVSNKKDGHRGARSYKTGARHQAKVAKRNRILKMREQTRRVFKFGEPA